MKKRAALILSCCMMCMIFNSCSQTPIEDAASSSADLALEEVSPLESESSVLDNSDALPNLTQEEVFQRIEDSFYLPNEEVDASITNNLSATVRTVFGIPSQEKVEDYIIPGSLHFYFEYALSPRVGYTWHLKENYLEFIEALKNGAHIKDSLAPYPDVLHAYFEAEEGALTLDPNQDYYYTGEDWLISGQPRRVHMIWRLFSGGRGLNFQPFRINMSREDLGRPMIDDDMRRQLLASDLDLQNTTATFIMIPGYEAIKLFNDGEHEYIIPGSGVQELQFLEDDVLYKSSEFAKELEWAEEHPFMGGTIQGDSTEGSVSQ